MAAKDSMLVKILDDDALVEYTQRDQLVQALNMAPPEVFIKQHPTAKNVKYIPIDKVEYLLTKIYQQWRTEILREGQLANSVYCTVRLHYKDPISGDWLYQDGIGAMDLQTAQGRPASDMMAIVSGAVQKALPAAKSYAVKDAAEQLGKIFGRDLNRREALAYDPSFAGEETQKRMEQIKNNAAQIVKDVEDEVPAN